MEKKFIDNEKVKDDKSVGWYKIITKTNHIIKISEEEKLLPQNKDTVNEYINCDRFSQCTQEQL